MSFPCEEVIHDLDCFIRGLHCFKLPSLDGFKKVFSDDPFWKRLLMKALTSCVSSKDINFDLWRNRSTRCDIVETGLVSDGKWVVEGFDSSAAQLPHSS